MKTKLLYIFICTVFITSCLSCVQHESPHVIFDEEEFESQKEKWKSQGLTNYSFEYYWGTVGRPNRIRGKVTIKDGNSVVELISYKDEKTVIDSSNPYYLKDIDAAFNLIYSKYTNYLERCKANYSKIWLDVFYDPIYGYPRNVGNCELLLNDKTPKEDLDGSSSGDFHLIIEKFVLTTQPED